MKDICDKQVSEVRKCNKDGSDMSILNLCATAPTFSVKCWEGVQSMDAGALICVHITKAMDVGEYDKNMLSEMEQAYQIAHNPDCYSSIPVAAVLLEDGK